LPPTVKVTNCVSGLSPDALDSTVWATAVVVAPAQVALTCKTIRFQSRAPLDSRSRFASSCRCRGGKGGAHSCRIGVAQRNARYRLWPPLDVGVPLVLGLTLTATSGRSGVAAALARPGCWLLVAAFALWNGWALVLMAKNHTAVLPGGPTQTVFGPRAVPRIPQPALPRAADAARRDRAAMAIVLGARRGTLRGSGAGCDPGSRKPEGQVLRRFLTRGSPMQRMTPLEPSGDDDSSTYPLRPFVDRAQRSTVARKRWLSSALDLMTTFGVTAGRGRDGTSCRLLSRWDAATCSCRASASAP
jgi:hypothetical protein